MINGETMNGHINRSLINTNHTNSFTPRSIVKSSSRKDTIEPKLIETKSVNSNTTINTTKLTTSTNSILTNPMSTIKGNCYSNPFQQSSPIPYHHHQQQNHYQSHSNYASYHQLNCNNQTTTGLTTSSISPTLLYQRKGSFYILLSLLILGIVLLILIAVGSIIVYITYSQRAKTRITIERKDSSCQTISCSFGADCVLDGFDLEPYCRCTHQCDNHVNDGYGSDGINQYVCGSDNVTYPSSCHLRLASCQLQQPIFPKHNGSCHGFQRKCVDSDCKYGSQCVSIKDGHGSECLCPEKCLEYPEVLSAYREKFPHPVIITESMVSTKESVCGIDGEDYENLCQLKKISCLKKKPISIKYFGLCDPCSTMMCPSDQICRLNDERRPFCSCNNTCSTMNNISDSHHSNFNNNNKDQSQQDDNNSHHHHHHHNNNHRNGLTIMTPTTSTIISTTIATTSLMITNENNITSSICGSDGNLYQTECYLQRESCVKKIDIKPLPSSNCIQGHHPCHKISCSYGGKCIVDKSGSGKCVCQQCETIYKPICGSNRVTYDSVCHMLRDSCLKKVNLTVSYSGPCENYQAPIIQTNGGITGTIINGGDLINSNGKLGINGSTHDVPCTPDNCHFGGVCVQTKESDHQMKSICQCPQCSDESDVTCGSNGISYPNECELRKAQCQEQKAIYISHKGPCRSCDKLKCKYYAICEAGPYNNHECVCPQVCIQNDAPICGSNGITYDNECELRVRSCLAQTEIIVAKIGPCDMCQNVNCKNGAQCENGRCVCPSSCPDEVYEPICANDGNTYPNECEMRKNACRNDKDLRSLFYGQCEEIEDEPANFDSNGSIGNQQPQSKQSG